MLSSGVWETVVVIAFAVDPNREAVHDSSSAHHDAVDWAHLPIATGILVVSLSGKMLPEFNSIVINRIEEVLKSAL